MKKKLTRIENKLFYFENDIKKEGKNELMNGDCTELSGDCTGLSGDCSTLWGDCSRLSGNCTGLSGDIDDCDITQEERGKGINIKNLVQ